MTELEIIIDSDMSERDLARTLIGFDWEPLNGWESEGLDTLTEDFTPKFENTPLEFQSLWMQGKVSDKVYQAVTLYFEKQTD